MSSQGSARTRLTPYKRKLDEASPAVGAHIYEASPAVGAHIYESPSKRRRSSLSRLSQSITSSLKVTKRRVGHESVRQVLDVTQNSGGYFDNVNKSVASHNHSLSDHLNGSLTKSLRRSMRTSFNLFDENTCEFQKTIHTDSSRRLNTSSTCVGQPPPRHVCDQRPPKFRKAPSIISYCHRPEPEGWSQEVSLQQKQFNKTERDVTGQNETQPQSTRQTGHETHSQSTRHIGQHEAHYQFTRHIGHHEAHSRSIRPTRHVCRALHLSSPHGNTVYSKQQHIVDLLRPEVHGNATLNRSYRSYISASTSERLSATVCSRASTSERLSATVCSRASTSERLSATVCSRQSNNLDHERASLLNLRNSRGLNNTYSHAASLAVGDDGGSSNQKLITACSVNNIACQADQGLVEKSGRVASWAVNFEKLLKDPIGIGIFTEFLKKEFSEENVIFWKACEQYRQLADDHQRKSQAKDIYSRYLSTKASDPVNVDSAARTYSERFLDNPTAIMFDVAQQQIFQLMRQDSYARFLKSDFYKSKLMDEMAGKVLEGTAEEEKFSDSKKKGKGKENDDKRRRSILPWRQNRKSVKSTSDPELKKQGKKGKENKDKEMNNNHNVSVVSSGTTTTVTTSSNSNGVNVNLKKAPGPGIDLSTMRKEVFHLKELKDAPEVHFKFCRIVMPDGSTTVVCAKPGQTSRSVLSKLCEKRSISIASVDVFLLGSDRPLDLNEDISTLGSKEIVIERRVLFRLDFPNNKSIGVKAKPNRSIRDVFKPILSKYGFRIENIAVHLIGNMDFLDLDMSVSEIENQRVVIVTDVDSAEILRQGAQPAASRLPKAPPASRSKSGHFGTRGGSLEEITNKIFEDLMRGKSQLAHGFDELGVLELDKAKGHKNEEGRSLALFGLLRKESVAAKEASKTSKLKGKVTFSLPKNESKKKSNAKEGERLFEMLSSAQKMRLEEQRGVLVTPGELPSFLSEDIKTGCMDEVPNKVEEKHMKQINDAQSGLNMFDDVAEISKAGFLEKKKHELFNYPTSTYSSHFPPRDTNKIISKKTPTFEKWKLHVERNLPQDDVLTSEKTETFFRMSPLVIDSKETQSSDNFLKNNLSLNVRAPVASPESFSPDSKKPRSSPDMKNPVVLSSPFPDQMSPNISPVNSKTSLNNAYKNFTSDNSPASSYQTGKLNLATANKNPSPQMLSLSKNLNVDFLQQQAHEIIKSDTNGKDHVSNNINSYNSVGVSPGTKQANNKHYQTSNGTTDTRDSLHSSNGTTDTRDSLHSSNGHDGRVIQLETFSPTKDFSQRKMMSPRFELSPKYRSADPPPYRKRNNLISSPNVKPNTELTKNGTQWFSPPVPVFSSTDTTSLRPGSYQPVTEQFAAVSPSSVFQFVDDRNLQHSNQNQHSPHPSLNSAKLILLPYHNTDQEEETVTFV